LAGDTVKQTPDSPEASTPSGRAGAILARLEDAGLNRRLAIAALAPLVAFVATVWLIVPTLAPGLFSGAGGGDTAEFQTVTWVLGTAHPTGYPSYVILGFIVTHLLPFGDPAYRMNLLGAILAAGAVAGTVAVIQFLTGMRWVALATGLLLLIMPTWSAVPISFQASSFLSSPVVWRLSTYADPHVFHLALVTLIFLLLLVWERRRTEEDPEGRRRADRWLVAAAVVYGVAFANHSLTLMLAPAIGLFVLAVAPRIVLQWRLILACIGVLGATIVILFLELPIRAAMHAPVVYSHPDTWSGFLYVVLGQQFGGIPPTIGDDLGLKYATVMNFLSSVLGPLGFVAALGLGTSLVKRPRYVLLGVVAAAVTCAFSASYANSDIERYLLVPVFVAFTFVGLGLADTVSIGVWLAEAAAQRFATRAQSSEGDPAHAGGSSWWTPARVAVEAVVAVALIAASFGVVADRQHVQDADHPGGVSQTNRTWDETWVRAVLAPADQGGLPTNSVIVGWWGDSTRLWYGQNVLGLRPDIHVVDDSMRVRNGDNLGNVWDVIDSYLGQRPVFVDRLSDGCDGMDVLGAMYQMKTFALPSEVSMKEVVTRNASVIGQC
jgi:hypothetical protein